MLEVKFKTSQKISDVLIRCSQTILTMCQFMAFRKNVMFDEIALIQKERSKNRYEFYREIASCYIKDDNKYEYGK